jgi:antitoxin component YwqK of YwqJK toxin-antitoxin module
MRTYLKFDAEFWDVDDNHSTHVRGSQPALLVIEGQMVNGKREGGFKAFLLDSLDQNKRYKIWEQQYRNDSLNGEWRTYNLAGTLVETKTLLNNMLNGISRQYWIDGKTVMKERIFYNSTSHFTERFLNPNGKIRTEVEFKNDLANGIFKEYYESGILMDSVRLVNNGRDGLRLYNYPNGKPWIIQEYKKGKPWNIIVNYDSKGNKRDSGTLKDGNGTVIFYEDDTTIREVLTYKNGDLVK